MGDVIAFRRQTPAPGPAADAAAPAPKDRDAPTAPVHGQSEPLWRHLAGHELRAARHRRQETLAQVATRAGVSVQYLSEVERGRKEPSSEVLAAVVGALEITLLDLTRSVTHQLGRPRRVATGSVRAPDPVALAA